MKKLGLLFGLMIAMFTLSCEGPAGPPGPPGLDGLDGLDGINILGRVYDIEGDFSPSTNPPYSIFTEFSVDAPSVEVFETDVVLVYILWEQLDDSSGPIDVWRPLPQVRLVDQGILQYNYDYTFLDATIYLETDFDEGLLLPGDTDNQIFRIAILPADGVSSAKLDTSNMQAVLDYLGVKESEIPRYSRD